MEIAECITSEQVEAAWPVIAQLRQGIAQSTLEQRLASARPEGYRLFAALQDGRVVGAIGFRLLHDLASGRSLYIDDLVVDEGERGRDIGRALMTFAEEAATGAGCEAIRLTSAMFREGAHAFYERLGFARPGYVFKKELVPPSSA